MAGVLGPVPSLLSDVEEQRRRDLIRMRLFGEASGPTRVGRFVLLQRLGAGAMGAVYAAYDEQLERKVALKLLLPSKGERDGERQDRLLREAQALARLSHPNIVTVYEIGVHEGHVFIAMELVRGQTLRAWRAAAPRTVREVLSAFIQAGRGLAAAHDQDIVHKDFKPENVMVGDDGRVRVLDFGLAMSVQPPAEPAPAATFASGTPAYMAPEQHVNDPVDARTDQFAFCVALYEALYGERPFEGQDRAELASAVARGALRPAASGAEVPTWLRAVVVRGLRASPDERWPAMHALVSELQRDPGAKRRRWLAAAGVATLVSAATWTVSSAMREPDRSCEGGRERIREVWGETQQRTVGQALRGSRPAYATDIALHAGTQLDVYAAKWAEEHREACVAHRRGEQSDELLDLRMDCLEARRREMGALVKVLQEGSDDIVERAIQATGGLEPLDRCANATRLRAEATSSPTPEDEPLHARLAAARADELAGLYDRSLKEAAALVGSARPRSWLAAEALYQLGSVQEKLGHHAEAGASLQEAHWQALAVRHDWLASRAANKLLLVLGHRQALFDAAQRWEGTAMALVERLGQERQLRADFLLIRGMVRQKQGMNEEAEEDYRGALSIYEELFGPDHRAVAIALGSLADIVNKKGDVAESLRLKRLALSINERSLGRNHPALAADLNGLGMVLRDHGDLREAFTHLRRALEIKETTFGKEDPTLALNLNNIGDALLDAAREEDAMQHYRRALQVSQLASSPDEIRIAFSRHGLGRALLRMGRVKEARAQLEQALEARTRARLRGADAGPLGETLSCLGDVLQREGHRTEAAARYQEALAILERSYGERSLEVAYPLAGLGGLRLASGGPASAIPLLERAVELRATRGARLERAQARFLLASALAAARPSASAGRPRELAAEALRDLAAVGPETEGEAAEIRKWLAAGQGGGGAQ